MKRIKDVARRDDAVGELGELAERPGGGDGGEPGGVDRDAGAEVDEDVAVDVFDGCAAAANRHEGVGARQARRQRRAL